MTRTCCHLADKYAELYSDLEPPINKDVIVAGAVLHDIGKLRELAVDAGRGRLHGRPAASSATCCKAATSSAKRPPAGRSIPKLLLRLEHVIVSHQRLPEWGAPKPPMTPEALIVHYADDLDAKMQMIVCALKEDTTERAR